jgi:cytochrome c556
MNRTLLVAAAALVLGAAAVSAQTDPIAQRRALMKANGDQAKIGVAMAKGEVPFDVAKAKLIFATFADAASKMPNLFPEDSKTGGDTAALPKIWEDMADVKARFAKFGEDATAAEGSVTDLASFKAAFGNIGKTDCGGCHELYRRKKT